MTKREVNKLNVKYHSELQEIDGEFILNKHKQLVIRAGNLSITATPNDTPCEYISLIKFLRRIIQI